ncbi:unnamed protein product [Echinostoma caproni]|uniref:PINc domain-containing protein n=1 Tax=Echinostoma caproni TaxID=27848 RepID=A0A183BCG1_9TREM|nr:unnamed protein product [Echinostoma caproni]
MGKTRKTRKFRFTCLTTMCSSKKKDQHKKIINPFKENTSHHALGPPYHILLDTNYVNFSIKNRLDLFRSIMDCLLAKCFLYVTDCVMGEIEKMPERYRVALKILRDDRIQRLTCQHRGTYADDCLVERCQSRCYIVATCDRDLKRRIRKITGVPIMYIRGHRVTVEKMPMALGAPKL